jgi:hypothetical protein
MDLFRSLGNGAQLAHQQPAYGSWHCMLLNPAGRQPGQGELLFDGRATGLTWYTFVDHPYQYLTNLALSKEYHSLGFVPVSSKLLVLKACMHACRHTPQGPDPQPAHACTRLLHPHHARGGGV